MLSVFEADRLKSKAHGDFHRWISHLIEIGSHMNSLAKFVWRSVTRFDTISLPCLVPTLLKIAFLPTSPKNDK